MKLYLHIGMSKTGTSSIQLFLWKNRELLLTKYGILYPETGIHLNSKAHYYLSWSIFTPNSIKQKIKDIEDAESIFRKLYFEIKDKEPQVIVLSSEYFMILEPETIKEVLLALATDINICLYIRRQDIWMESNYSQAIKIGDLKQYKFSDFLAHHQRSKERDCLYNYYNFLTRWQKAFPEAKIIPRIYDRKLFPEGNVILDFLSILGIDMPEAREQKIEANPSLSHLSTLVLRKINEKFDLSTEEHGKVVQYLLQLDKDEGSPLKTFFTLEERLEFLEHFKESNERLFREWFNSENKFVLSDEEIKFYEEQDKILKEDAEHMVEERYRKVITYLMEERITPKGRIVSIKRPEINYHPTEEIEFLIIDVLQADLLKEGRLNIGGLVLLKKEIEGDYKLIAKDGEGEKEITWEISSPYFAEKYPHNPKAKNARFYVSGVVPKEGKPIQILLKSKDGETLLIDITISTKGKT